MHKINLCLKLIVIKLIGIFVLNERLNSVNLTIKRIYKAKVVYSTS